MQLVNILYNGLPCDVDAGAFGGLLDYYNKNPDCKDIVQGPLMYDGLEGCLTHFVQYRPCHKWR